MKKKWIFLSLAIILILVFILFFQKKNQVTNKNYNEPARICSPKIARIIGQIYVLSSPVSKHDRLMNIIQQNGLLFSENSNVIICMKKLGNRLVYRGLASFSQSDYDNAYGRALEMGATAEQAQGVSNSIINGSVDLELMGKELVWLAKVLPAAADGNWDPFNTTGSQWRIQIRQVLQLYTSIGMMDGGTMQIFNAAVKKIEPIAEEQIVMLALMYNL